MAYTNCYVCNDVSSFALEIFYKQNNNKNIFLFTLIFDSIVMFSENEIELISFEKSVVAVACIFLI